MKADKSQVFQFRRFSVCHARCAMKVGTDGVLLGLLSPVSGRRFLDIGTGSGLVALLLAQRAPEAQITGIDIDGDAVGQAADNFNASPWAARLQSVRADACDFAPQKNYDLIVSNPPYYENSPDASSIRRDAARRCDSLPHACLVATVVRLLAADGCFSVILPARDTEHFIFQCWQSGLHLRRRHRIFTKPGKPCKREVLVFSRESGAVDTAELLLTEASGCRSKAYADLVKDFFIR